MELGSRSILSSLSLTSLFRLFLLKSKAACSYLINPPPGNNPPSTIPAAGEDGSKPNKFKWVPVKPTPACASVEVGK